MKLKTFLSVEERVLGAPPKSATGSSHTMLIVYFPTRSCTGFTV